jgi:hypothetical protein
MSVGRDLFGTWVVDISFGQLGCRGRALRLLADTETVVRRILRQRLRRRTAPPKPPSLSYQIREIIGEIHWLAPTGRTGLSKAMLSK